MSQNFFCLSEIFFQCQRRLSTNFESLVYYSSKRGPGKTMYIVSASFRYGNGYIWQAILTKPNLPLPLT
jgi:hypothetical protein